MMRSAGTARAVPHILHGWTRRRGAGQRVDLPRSDTSWAAEDVGGLAANISANAGVSVMALARRLREMKTQDPRTLAIDVGGTGLKASVLDASGAMTAKRVRVPTPYPCSPDALVQELDQLVTPLPAFDRVSVGFPGVIRDGMVLSAPEFVRVGGLGTRVDPPLVDAWSDDDLSRALSRIFKRPVKVANDADLQRAAVV